jgi:hypothetical protein
VNDHFRTLTGIIAVLLGAIAIALALTGVYLIDFRGDCQNDGGNFSIDGTTAWCRY